MLPLSDDRGDVVTAQPALYGPRRFSYVGVENFQRGEAAELRDVAGGLNLCQVGEVRGQFGFRVAVRRSLE